MRSNFTQLYLHCVWATWDRLPLITLDIQQQIYAVIIKECTQLECTVIAIGGIEDHIHLLVRFPTTLNIAQLIKQIKGSSSHFVTHEINPGKFFKWQGGYGAFTVSHNGIDNIADYIRNQPLHHKKKSIVSDWELTPTASV
ncbi:MULTISPECIES: IS200/IS605 family transposase [Nostocales]|uniref:Transposase n=3 Tax=Nostocales TaxID=1161 RepID=A0A0C1QQU1_9CYAN|nr:IS200/IS605 family transposase [Tolypothrix bouteillei]KAF3888604.1 IS200/IS605 family transposase [Tolypothrix bouteillei VB521301]